MKKPITMLVSATMVGALALGVPALGIAATGTDGGQESAVVTAQVASVPDGSYDVAASLSDPSGLHMVYIAGDAGKLTVKDGQATVRFKLGGTSIDYLFIGTGEQAKAAGSDGWVKYEPVNEKTTVAGTTITKTYYYFTVSGLSVSPGTNTYPLAYHSQKSGNWFDRTLTVTYSAKPGKVAGVKAKSPKKRQAKVTWKKLAANVTGYQVRHAAKKGMGGAKTVTVKGASKTSLTVKKLASGKKRWFQVRGINGAARGAWSSVASVKVK